MRKKERFNLAKLRFGNIESIVKDDLHMIIDLKVFDETIEIVAFTSL